MNDYDKPPQWVRDYVSYLDTVFTPELSINVRMNLDDDSEWAGQTNIDWTDLRARIRLRADLEPGDQEYEYITHEFFHIVGWAYWQAQEQLEKALPKRERKWVRVFLHNAEEQTMQRMARSLTPVLRADFQRQQAKIDAVLASGQVVEVEVSDGKEEAEQEGSRKGQ